MAKTLRYKGPAGFAVPGVAGELKPGSDVEIEDDAIYESLKGHPWFESASSRSASSRKRRPRRKTGTAKPAEPEHSETEEGGE